MDLKHDSERGPTMKRGWENVLPYMKYIDELVMATRFASLAIRLTIFPMPAPALGSSAFALASAVDFESLFPSEVESSFELTLFTIPEKSLRLSALS